MLQKKRILIFSTAYKPFIGGAEVAVREITDRIPEIEFVMITAKLDAKLTRVEKIGNIEVHRLGKGGHWDKYRLISQGARYAQKLGHFDVVWGIMASYAGFASLRYKKRENRPFLLTLQEGDSRWDIYRHVWFIWPYFKQIFKRADRIQAISNYLADWAKNMGAKCPIEVVPNGVNLDKFRISNFEFQNNFKSKIFNDLNISEDAKLIVTVSRLVKKNGVEDLIEAMEFLSEDVQLLVVGGGQLEQKLKKIANDGVHFLGDVSHDELPHYLGASDVFCRPSLSEGLGNAFLEAMACGVPVVGTKVGGILDFLKDNETGLFCKVGNPEDIAEKIKKIVNDESLRGKLVENGSKLVQEKYSWDLIARQMQNIFNNLCSQ